MVSYQVQRTWIAKAEDKIKTDLEPQEAPPNNYTIPINVDLYDKIGRFQGPVDVVSAHSENTNDVLVVARMLGLKKSREVYLDGLPAAMSETEKIEGLPQKLDKLKAERRINDYACHADDNCTLKIDR